MKPIIPTPQQILVVGSSNTDMVVRSAHLPRPGETVLGGTFLMNPGGKGANQAVAVARLGGQVTFICKVGSDIFGHQARQLFEEEGIDTTYVCTDTEHPSGVALITVDDRAENCIVVASGANAYLLPEDLKGIEKVLDRTEILLVQLEIPLETVEYVAALARERGKKLILNPAPARPLSRELLECLYLITPNETEAEMISGVKIVDETSAIQAAVHINEMGVDNVIITLGSKGALVYADRQATRIPAYEIQAVDTTAAGDVFNGALAVSLSEGNTLIHAARFACKASALSISRVGAQASVPYRNELDITDLPLKG